MQQSNIPARHSYHAFASMVYAIKLALDAYPGVVKVNPGKYSVETFARKFREARNAALQYSYTHLSIDQEKFRAVGLYLTTSMRNGEIWIGTRTALQQAEVVVFQPAESTVATFYPQEFHELCRLLLCFCGKWENKPKIRVCYKIEQTLIDQLESENDIVLSPVEGQKDTYQLI